MLTSRSRPQSGSAQIFIIGADGSGRRQITGSSGDKHGPSLSRDGRFIAFHTRRAGNNDVFVVDVATGNERKITKHAGSDFSPTFSPDGKKIAFVSSRHGRKNLYTMNSIGHGLATRLTDTSKAIDGQASWSPNGKEIAFVEGWRDNWDIKIINAQRGASRRLTSGEAPDWSPDGTRIIFDTSRHSKWGDSELYIVDVSS